jgi:hypothetical protein
MLQSLIDIDDDQMETVLVAVSSWCNNRGVSVDSDEGRHAVSIAVDVICSRNLANLEAELQVAIEKNLTLH